MDHRDPCLPIPSGHDDHPEARDCDRTLAVLAAPAPPGLLARLLDRAGGRRREAQPPRAERIAPPRQDA
jgi:hypothetical protein